VKVRVFVPADDDFSEYETSTDVIPPEGAAFRLADHAGREFAVDYVLYLLEGGQITPQIWLKDTGPRDMDDWIQSMAG
jgi:hypothetical protein